MSKRQIRLNSKESIVQKLPEISGKKVNIVFLSGRVVFVLIESFSDNSIRVSDMRKQRADIELKEISEIIIDIEA